MATSNKTLFASTCRGLRALNYDLHLMQHGLAQFIERHPWVGVPLAGATLVGLWTIYWPIYLGLLALTIVAWVVRPLELALQRGS
jgi:hypothetical protein